MANLQRLILSNFWRNVCNSKHAQWRLPQIGVLGVRHSSYRSSQEVQPLEEYPDVEVVQNPPEWKYVERLLPPEVVPKPTVKTEYPSGWKPVSVGDAGKLKYFVARTKNHMVPVYLYTRFRGMRRVTIVKRIHGDIWELEQELREVVKQARQDKLCATRVNEMSGQIQIHGDYVDIVREYLKEKGF